jgi:hypothetical protein
LETFIGKGIENLFALCDDGAVFAYSHEGEWWQLPPIPQDNKDEDPRQSGNPRHYPTMKDIRGK